MQDVRICKLPGVEEEIRTDETHWTFYPIRTITGNTSWKRIVFMWSSQTF